MRKLAVVLLLLGSVAFLDRSVQAQPLDIIQGPFGPGGTYNLYQFETVPLQWWEANGDAAGRTKAGVSGHLIDDFIMTGRLALS